MKRVIITVIIFSLLSQVSGQKNWKQLFDKRYFGLCTSNKTFRENCLAQSSLGDAMKFMDISGVVDGLKCMYSSTKDEIYLNDEIKLINNILSTAEVSKNIPYNTYLLKDDYLSWTSKTPGYTYNSESPVYEGYIFRDITQFLYILKKSGWTDVSAQNNSWYTNALSFIEKNIWEKWTSRSNRINGQPYTILLSRRTHVASHWAYIALMLNQITQNPVIKSQSQELCNMYDLLLKRNLKPNPNYPQAYIWNSSWDNVEGTQASIPNDVALQDVAHGNQVIAYVVAAEELGNPTWKPEDISYFTNTILQVVYNAKTLRFSEMVDGSSPSNSESGNFQTYGWVKLGRLNKKAKDFYLKYAIENDKLVINYGPLQYYANLSYNDYAN